MPLQAILFDFGGVLVRTEDYSGRRKWEARLGLPPGGAEKAVFDCPASVRATAGEIPADEVWQAIAAGLSLNPEQFQEFRRDFFAGDRLDSGLVDFLRSLRPRYKTAILSNAWSNARRMFLDDFGLGPAVDAMIISAEEGVGKPAARIYHIAAARLGVPPAACLLVDDFPANVEGARAAGMQAVRFVNAAQARADVERLLRDA